MDTTRPGVHVLGAWRGSAVSCTTRNSRMQTGGHGHLSGRKTGPQRSTAKHTATHPRPAPDGRHVAVAQTEHNKPQHDNKQPRGQHSTARRSL
jgi:hypothetical protein